MNRFVSVLIAACLLLLLTTSAFAADIAGKWTAKFDSPVGEQSYVYDFKVTGNTFTGHAKSNLGEGPIADGKIDGDNVTFVETLKTPDMELRIEYSGKVTGDEMKLTRKVGEFGSEDLVAKRAK